MLSDYDSGKFGRISTSVTHSKTNVLCEDKLSDQFQFDDGTIILEPKNFYKSNLGIFNANSKTVTITQKYFYNPRKLSKELYGTPELYLLILAMNDMATPFEFTSYSVQVLNPNKINVLLDLVANTTFKTV